MVRLAGLGRPLARELLAAFDRAGRQAGCCCLAGPSGMAGLPDGRRAGPGQSPRDEKMPNDTPDAVIRAAVGRWAQALRDKDAAAVQRECGPRQVAYTLAPPLVSRSAGTAGLQSWFDTWQGPLGYDLRDLAVTVGGDVGFCHFLTHLTGRKTDGEEPDLWFRQTLGFRRIDGAWKIVHQHQSVPFHMDGSYRAAVDLAP